MGFREYLQDARNITQLGDIAKRVARPTLRSVSNFLGLAKTTSDSIVRMGANWEACLDKPVIFLWKINPWKRPHIIHYLDEYRVAFVRGNRTPKALRKRFPELFEGEFALGIWGADVPNYLKSFADKHRSPLLRIEDGFLRSLDSGALHTRPHSLVFDHTGLYFDARHGSDLQNLFDSVDLDGDADLKAAAIAGLKIFRAAKLSKYYSFFADEKPVLTSEEGRRKVLIVGQVERDASIRLGNTNVFRKRGFSNETLIRTIAERYPADELFFRPHPDLRGRKGRVSERLPNGRSLATVSSRTPVAEILEDVDEVITQTSLTGFEAVIKGVPTTVYGAPFYAGRGLTNDMNFISGRDRSLSVEEMFAATYLQYPRYVHPYSDSRCSFFDVAGSFIVDQVKHYNIRNIPSSWIDFEELRAAEEYLPPSARVLLYLSSLADGEEADLQRFLGIVGDNLRLEDALQISELLISAFSYDVLKVFANISIENFINRWPEVKTDVRLLENFFSAICLIQSNQNGRIIDDLPDFVDEICELYSSDDSYGDVVVFYVRALSNYLQYGIIERLIDRLSMSDQANYVVFQKICNVLRSRPARSERAHSRRRALLIRAADAYRERLSAKFPDRVDVFMNGVLYCIAIDDPLGAIEKYNLFLSNFKGGKFSIGDRKLISQGRLSKRISHFFQLVDFLMKKGHLDFAKKVLRENLVLGSAFRDRERRAQIGSQIQDAWIGLSAAEADHRSVMERFAKASRRTQGQKKTSGRYIRALRSLGEFHEARRLLRERLQAAATPAEKVALKQEIEKVDFSIETSKILRSYPQPKIPKGVVFLASQNCYNTLAMMTPALYSLKKKGYAVVNLIEGMVVHEHTGLEFIDRFANSIPSTLYRQKLENEWEVNWENRSVKSCGVDFYQGFYERLSTQSRRFHVDINEKQVNEDFMMQLKRSDVCLSVCVEVFRDLVLRGINVVFVSGNSHVAPYSIFRDFARAKNHPGLSFINCNVAYESYFSNLGSRFASTMCVTDMTLYPNRRAPFMALPQKFQSWYEENREDEALQSRANEMIQVNRNSSKDDGREKELISWLERLRADGKKIVCAFGKVPVDLNVPYDGGPAHIDMEDWLNDTVRIAAASNNLVLLVKPHPHELRPEIALDLVDGFADLITEEHGENVVVLGHRDINVHALAPYLDLAVLWNGSSSLELTALGKPVLMASYFGKYDYPVDLNYPESRKQYEDYLLAGEFTVPTMETRRRAAFLISYLGTLEISIPNDYSYRQLTNDKVGMPRWRPERISEFLANGDKMMDLIADQVVEKFQN